MEMWANKEKQRYRAYYKNIYKNKFLQADPEEEEEGTLNTVVLPKGLWCLMTGHHFFPFPNQTYDPEVQDDSNIRETWTYYTICVY